MEGLLIAEQLRRLAPQLPSERSSWRFSDPHTFILPLANNSSALWLYNKPPNPRLDVAPNYPAFGRSYSGFQDLLLALAVGRLERVEQVKLDRVVRLEFAAAQGFVDTDAVTLIAELTGRNCNLILCDSQGMILGAARDVSADINRFRQVRRGLPYQSPPPYDKHDPRTASDAALKDALQGRKLKALRQQVDGFGPELSRALAVLSGMSLENELDEAKLEQLLPQLRALCHEPSAMLTQALGRPDLKTLRAQELRQVRLERLQEALDKQRQLLHKRLADIERSHQAAAEADSLREEADLLMAYQYQLPKHVESVEVTDFTGQPRSLRLDPRLDIVANAEQRYSQIKKRQQRHVQAQQRQGLLEQELTELDNLRQALPERSNAELDALLAKHAPPREQQYRSVPYIRYRSPQGYRILVGRKSRDNDTVTFKLARSRDVWLHVQGYPGSHVIIQAENKEVPFETILFAAQLAAAYSKAHQSDNVAVDYTLRKHVWKNKGGEAGSVHFSQQKTVYVTPDKQQEHVSD